VHLARTIAEECGDFMFLLRSLVRRAALVAAIALGATAAAAAAAAVAADAASDDSAVTASGDAKRQAICQTVDRIAAVERLPAAFLTRVLWQESRFRSDAVSPKGAQGVAQFMPPTARDYGLADPWEPASAITAAGRLLAELATRFGNLGLAAAAYNAGAGRVEKWLRAESGLPAETRAYVRSVTGRDIQDWTGVPARAASAPGPAPASAPDRVAANCAETIARLPHEPIPALSVPTAATAADADASPAAPLDRLLRHALSLAEDQSR
jgi:hypothetical protein